MKRAIIVAVAIILQVLYYLSIFEIISIDLSDSFWTRFMVGLPAGAAGYIIMYSCVKHLRKWHYNTTYLLMVACGVFMYLNLSGVYLGSPLHSILFTTIFPLSYGAYLHCDTMKSDDSWHFVTKNNLDTSLIVDRPEGIETRIKLPEVAPQLKPYISQPQIAYVAPLIDCTREEMLSELLHSSKLSNEKLFEIKDQLVGGLQELNVEIERVKMDIGVKSVTCQLRYDTIPTAIRASGFPCNINIFYRLLSIDREEKIMIIDIPYREQSILC